MSAALSVLGVDFDVDIVGCITAQLHERELRRIAALSWSWTLAVRRERERRKSLGACTDCGEIATGRHEMMTSGQCVNCWLVDEDAQYEFCEFARVSASSTHKWMLHAPSSEFNVDMALDGHRDDEEADSPIDPQILAMEHGYQVADVGYIH